MTVSTIGQAFNVLSYHRRRNVLMNIVPDKKKVKDILSENTDVLNENYPAKLFGDKFNVNEQLKIIKKSKEYLNVLDEERSTTK